MFSRFYSWLTGSTSRDSVTRDPCPTTTLHLHCSAAVQHRPPQRQLPLPRKRRKVSPSNFCRSYQSCSSVIDGYSSRSHQPRQLSPSEKLDKFRSITEFVDLVDLESSPAFRDHDFVSGIPLTTPFFRAILEHPNGPRQLPPHRWASEAHPINNTAFAPPAAPAPSDDDIELAFTPSRRWAWGAQKSIHASLPIDYVQGFPSTTFNYGVLENYPLVYMNTMFSDTKEFLKEITLHRELLCPLQGSIVMHPINATKRANRLCINYEPPHHSFWISASPSMPECLKVLVKCAYVQLHRQGVVHGHINLGNILITANLDVVLHGFGRTPNVLVKIDGMSNCMRGLPEDTIAEKVRVDELLKMTPSTSSVAVVDEPVFTVVPGQSREELKNEVQGFLFRLDRLEQEMFGEDGGVVKEEYRELAQAFDKALQPLPLRMTRIVGEGSDGINGNGKRRASFEDEDEDGEREGSWSPSKRARTGDDDSGSSTTLLSDTEEGSSSRMTSQERERPSPDMDD